MITTLNILVLLILIIGNGYSIKKLQASNSNLESMQDEINNIIDNDVTRSRRIKDLQESLESIAAALSDFKKSSQNLQTDVLESKVAGLQLSVENLYADLDRTIGTIDQIQEKLAETNVTVENIVNRLNSESK